MPSFKDPIIDSGLDSSFSRLAAIHTLTVPRRYNVPGLMSRTVSSE